MDGPSTTVEIINNPLFHLLFIVTCKIQKWKVFSQIFQTISSLHNPPQSPRSNPLHPENLSYPVRIRSCASWLRSDLRPCNSPLGANFSFPLALLLLPLQSAKTATSIKPMTVNIPTPAPHFRYTTGNICPSFRAVLRAFHAQ